MERRTDGGLLGADLGARLEAWAASARVDEAARSRSRERWLRQAAEEEASLAGVLLDLADRGAAALLTTEAGRRHRGIVRAVGADFCALSLDRGGAALVRLSTLASVRPAGAGDDHALLGDRAARPALRLADVLAGLAAERASLLLHTGADSLSGDLRWVGRDVLAIRTQGEREGTTFVRMDAVSEVVLA